MPSERMLRRIDAFLDQAEEASDANDWSLVAAKARAILAIDPVHEDALGFLRMATANGADEATSPVAPEEHPDSLPGGDESFFVGREEELDRLRLAFDAMAGGNGSLVLIAGEAGIGKTRLAEQLGLYAESDGATVLWGRSHESEGTPAFWPWLQIAAAYARVTPEPQLLQDVRGDAQQLQILLPALGQLLPHLPSPQGDSASAEFELFVSAIGFLERVSERAPLVLVLDDLQWADKSTLLLLQHLASELPRRRTMIVGTFRDDQLDRAHPLTTTLASVNRTGALIRINLSGLGQEDVERYLRQAAGVHTTDDIVSRVRVETDGNPFFLREIAELLGDAEPSEDPAAALRVPEGVREALGIRLERLSPETTELLHLAAVIGREFSLHTLQLMLELSDDDLIRRLDEALGASVIEELPGPGEYQFVHALMMETLLDELSSARRARMHGEIAEALRARLGDDAETQAPVLARHYIESATLDEEHTVLAAHFSEEAGRSARRQIAWAVAADHFARAVELLAASAELGPSAELLHELGSSLRLAGEGAEAGRALDRAFDAAESDEDGIRMGEIALEAVGFDTVLAPERHIEMLEAALKRVGDADAELRARLLARRAWEALPDDATSRAAAAEARKLAEAYDLPEVLVELAERDVHGLMDEEEYERCQDLAYSSFKAARRAGRNDIAGHMLIDRAGSRLILGEIDRACEMAEEALVFALENQQPSWAGAARRILASRAFLRGEFDKIDAAVEQIPLDLGWGPPDLLQAKTAEILGDPLRALEILDQFERHYPLASAGALWPAHYFGLRSNIELHAGREIESVRALERCEALLKEIPEATYWRVAVSEVPDALPKLGSAGLVRSTYSRLAASRARATFVGAPFDVFRGNLGLRLALIAEAEGHFRSGLDWCELQHCPVEAGRCHQGLAEVAVQRGDPANAVEHLELASERFRECGAQLYLEQVNGRLETLTA